MFLEEPTGGFVAWIPGLDGLVAQGETVEETFANLEEAYALWVETQPTIVVNLKTSPYDVYIGRGSPFGNPFHIGPDGTREEVIEKFEAWLSAELRQKIKAELKGKRLGCFCKPKACHGDVLVKIVNEGS